MPYSNNINLLIWRTGMGGIEKSLYFYFDHLGDKYSFRIYSLRPIEQNDFIFGNQNASIYIGHKYNLLLYIKLLIYTLQHRREIFHVFNPSPVILCLLRLAGVRKVLVHLRGTVYWKTPVQKMYRKSCWKMALKMNPKIVANSYYSRDAFLRFIQMPVPVKTIYNPFQIHDNYSETGTGKGPFTILYVGRLVPGKNMFTWLRTAKFLLDRFTDIQFRIVGDGPLRKSLVDETVRLGIERAVTFCGNIDDARNIYRDSHLLLFLSEKESFGNVVVESILNNTPVIASSIPSIREIFEDFPEFLVDLDENLNENVYRKIKAFESLLILTQKAKKVFSEKFSAHLHLNLITEIYEELQRQL